MNQKRKPQRAPVVSRIADAAVTVPLTAARVALGASVLIARSLRDVALQTRGLTRQKANQRRRIPLAGRMAGSRHG